MRLTFHDGGEGEPLPDELPGPEVTRAAPGQQPVHARLVVQVGRDDGGEGLRVLDGVEHVTDQVVEGQGLAGLVQVAREERAQREGERPVRHVSRTVGGVLGRVVEQEGLALLRFERDLLPCEQLGHRRGGQSGQPGSEEAHRIVGVARGAALIDSGFVAGLLLGDRQDEAGIQQVSVVLGHRQPVRTLSAVQDQGRRLSASRRGPGLADRCQRVLLLRDSGGDEVAHPPLLPAHAGAPDLVVGHHQLLGIGLRGDGRPAGAAAVAAVHGGQPYARLPHGGVRADRGLRPVRAGHVPDLTALGLLVALGGCCGQAGAPRAIVLVPVELGLARADSAQDPADRPDPQVGLHVEQRARAALVRLRIAGSGQHGHEPRECCESEAGILPGGPAPGVPEPAEAVAELPFAEGVPVQKGQHPLSEIVLLEQPSDLEGGQALLSQHPCGQGIEVELVRTRHHIGAARVGDDLLG